MAITTRTSFKIVVQEHIIDRLSTDHTTVLKEQLQNVVDEFKNWYTPYEQKRTPNRQAAFIDWLWGLPSSINQEYEYHEIEKAYRRWFECNGVEVNPKMKPADIQKWYYLLVHREFCTLCKRNGVEYHV